jgi:hypothetical protein
MVLTSSHVRNLYQDAHKVGWPPYKDFANELKELMPRKTIIAQSINHGLGMAAILEEEELERWEHF